MWEPRPFALLTHRLPLVHLLETVAVGISSQFVTVRYMNGLWTWAQNSLRWDCGTGLDTFLKWVRTWRLRLSVKCWQRVVPSECVMSQLWAR